jgi:hypothetical protein
MPGLRIGATDWKAGWIEYGTGEPGPTKAYAPRARTAAHFGGDEQIVADIMDDAELSREERKTALQRFDINLVTDVDDL